MSSILWYQDRLVWSWLASRFLPWFAGLSLAWEIAQLPLYTIWSDAKPAFIAFAVAHCTVGDVLIGSAALVLALTLRRERNLGSWRWARIAVLAALLGAGYTVFSEWLNIVVLRSWAYAESMPTLEFAGIEIGLFPFLQWLLLPPLAVYLARRYA